MTRQEQITKRLRKLEDRYVKALAVVQSKYQPKIQSLRAELLVKCPHPKEFQKEISWEWDDGYGTQRQKTCPKCGICGMIDRWNRGFWSVDETRLGLI